jgi:two-component system LytT family response regulator
MAEPTVRVLVVDDEPIARAHLKNLLAADPEVTIVGESADGAAAVHAIRTLAPDVVFLDVQMPELDGFGVVREIGLEKMPPVVFVTAYDEYAVQAFEVSAVDYVMKPVSRERLTAALNRAKAHAKGLMEPQIVGRESLPALHLQELLERLERLQQPEITADDRIALRVDGRTLLIHTSTIDWLEAVDDYVRVRTTTETGKVAHLVRCTMAAFEQRLPSNFLRVHRSAIVNTDRVREIAPGAQGEYVVVLHDGTRVPTGRSYRANVTAFLRAFTDPSA